MSDLLIFPFNGNGVEALACLGPSIRLIGFVDDTEEKLGEQTAGTVFGRDAFDRHPDARVLAVPGSPHSFRDRRSIIDGLGLAPERFTTVVHPTASVSPLATVGRNVLLMANVVVTANAVIGDHVMVMPNTVIHHDVTIEELTIIGANVTIAGHVTVGRNAFLGSGTTVIDHIEIGACSLVGVGSTVIRPVATGTTVAGSPARLLE